MKVSEEGKAHRLLRVVWVYLEHEGEGWGVDQGELPEEYAEVLKKSETDPKNPKHNAHKLGMPLTFEHARDALEQLYEIFKDENRNHHPERFEEPWPNSNPCPGARPKYRV
jgi:hypothetical protein